MNQYHTVSSTVCWVIFMTFLDIMCSLKCLLQQNITCPFFQPGSRKKHHVSVLSKISSHMSASAKTSSHKTVSRKTSHDTTESPKKPEIFISISWHKPSKNKTKTKSTVTYRASPCSWPLSIVCNRE